MPGVTILEAGLILERMEEQINSYRRMIDVKISPDLGEITSVPATQESEVVERQKLDRPVISESIDELNDRINALTTKRNRILVAKKQFLSTKKFSY